MRGLQNIPASWIAAPLDQLVDVHYGKALPEKERDASGATPVIGSSGAVGMHSSPLILGPSVVVGRKGAAGAVHLIKQSSWPIDTAYFMQPPTEIEIQWLHLFLGNQQLGQLDKSTAIPSLSRDDLYKVKIPLAPHAEQERILEKLEELLSDLDAGVAELKAAQTKLTHYRQSLLKAAVEGSLTAAWRKAHPTPKKTGAQLLDRILTERRARWEAKQLAKFKEQGKAPPKGWQQKYPEPVQPDITELPALPEGWVWASAEQLCEFITKGTTPPKDLDDGRTHDVPFLRVTNLTAQGSLDMTDQVFVSKQTHTTFLARSVVYPNDVLMNIVGPPLGQVALVPSTHKQWNINQAIGIFRAVEGVLPSFVCTYLLSPIAQNWLKAKSKTTAGQTNLTLEVCRSLPVPLPAILEQEEIARIVAEYLDATKDQATAIGRTLKQSAAQRQNILRAAFSGQLVPQDPADEPASVLLERIRAERAASAPARKTRTRKAAA